MQTTDSVQCKSVTKLTPWQLSHLFISSLWNPDRIQLPIYRVFKLWCEQLRKFIGKKAMATEKLNAHHCKQQLKKFFMPYASSVCAPFVALNTSRHSTSCQTSCNKDWSVFAVAVRNRSFKLFWVTGIGGTQSPPSATPQRKDCKAQRCGARGGQKWTLPPLQPIRRLGNCLFNNVLTSLWDVRRCSVALTSLSLPQPQRVTVGKSPSYVCAELLWQQLKLLLAHACKKKILVALYNGACLIFPWPLLSCQ
jgi:hypothetical protein